MKLSETALKYHNEFFTNHKSKQAETDPDSAGVFDNLPLMKSFNKHWR